MLMQNFGVTNREHYGMYGTFCSGQYNNNNTYLIIIIIIIIIIINNNDNNNNNNTYIAPISILLFSSALKNKNI